MQACIFSLKLRYCPIARYGLGRPAAMSQPPSSASLPRIQNLHNPAKEASRCIAHRMNQDIKLYAEGALQFTPLHKMLAWLNGAVVKSGK